MSYIIEKLQPDTITVWEEILRQMQENLAAEKRKYPLNERDQIFEYTLTQILTKLDELTHARSTIVR
jgi:hypothetical protein